MSTIPETGNVGALRSTWASVRESLLLRVGRWSLNGLVGLVLAFLLLPTLIVIPMSLGEASYIQFPPKGLTLKWYQVYFSDPDWMNATFFSVKIALATTVSATVIGTLASFALVRGNLPGARALQALTLAPLIVPHIVLAVALYLVFAPVGLTGNFIGFAIAHTMLSVPYVMLTVSAALQRFDPALELAALNCGASRAQAFWHVVLPDIAPGVAAGAVFAFLASFDEATVAFFISGVEGKTITRKLFEDIDYNLTPVIAAVSTVMVVVSLVLMGGVELLRSRSANRKI
jgi:mannopine transport system permease protein